MGFRFNKRIKIAKGVNINLSKSGVGLSAGVKGLRGSVGPRGARVTTSIPDTGISKQWNSKKGRRQPEPETQYVAGPPAMPSPHSRLTVLIVCLLLGWLGVHRFLTGKILSGIIYLFTFGLFGVGWVYDFLRILLGGFPDGQGRKLSSFQNTNSARRTPQSPPPLTGVTITRGGKEVAADEVFAAANSQDLPRMLAAANLQTNPVDRHFLLLNIVGLTYKQRKQAEPRQVCIEFARLHIAEFPSIKPHLVAEMDGMLPRVSTFQNFATVCTEDGRFAEAVSVCEQAIALGLQDGTQSGFEGRIERIQKKQEASSS